MLEQRNKDVELIRAAQEPSGSGVEPDDRAAALGRRWQDPDRR